MRVRTGRFDGLRSCGKPGHPQLIEELVRQGHMEIHRRVAPPPAAVTCDLSGGAIAHPASTKLPKDGRTPLPVLELQRPEAVANPLIDVSKDPGRLGDPEVAFPSSQVDTQILAHGRYAPADNASGQSADVLLQALLGFSGHAPLDLPSWGNPEREAEELTLRGARHRTLGLVDAELQPRIETTHRLHHAFARPQ